ncbi:MAG: acyltransferase [Alphaproteobacteria bacterium]|nr:acyltransferase [Alphaproteobacteria bacterium]NNF24529.1 acyltransferase [Paracoccaceae bacterium]
MSLWSQAQRAAELTPAYRNRSADFFRAAAITIVVVGHWIVSVPRYVDGGLQFTELLVEQPSIQYVTWLVQVMPIFFLVGGYSNAASWASAQSDSEKRQAWQFSRLKRLLMPITPLILVWTAFAAIAGMLEFDPDLIRLASRSALIPVWFLAVYIMVSVAVPVSQAAWERFGLWSIAFLVCGAALIDYAGFGASHGWARWINYAFVWLGMHQLGYWWHRGIETKLGPLVLLGLGLVSLYTLIWVLDYPISMISVPDEEISNSRPPTFAMLAIGFIQAGVILLLTGRVAKWLEIPRPWAVVILVSQRIMTVYLWHLTALLILVGVSILAGGLGLKMTPGSAEWWLTRPLWLGAMALVLLPLIAIFGSLEAGSRNAGSIPPGPIRSTLGAVLACAGLTFMALNGTYGDNWLGINFIPIALTLAGVALATISRKAHTDE